MCHPTPRPTAAVPRAAAVLLIVVSTAGLLGCSDNATKLADGIARLVRGTGEPPARATRTVPYRPEARPDHPYTLIFFPDHHVTADDLVAAGLSRSRASRIFRDLDYIHVGEVPLLVVLQRDARLTFTSYWRRFAIVEDVLVLEGEGARQLLLENAGGVWVIRGWADAAPSPSPSSPPGR